MAHHKSALKRIRQAKKLRIYNRFHKKLLKTTIRSVQEATNYEEGMENLKKAYSVLDKVTAKGILPKNNAANKKASLNKHVLSLKK